MKSLKNIIFGATLGLSALVSGCGDITNFTEAVNGNPGNKETTQIIKDRLKVTIHKREESRPNRSKTGFVYTINLGEVKKGQIVYSGDGTCDVSSEPISYLGVLTTDTHPEVMLLGDFNKDGTLDAKIIYPDNDSELGTWENRVLHTVYGTRGETKDPKAQIYFTGGVETKKLGPINEMGISSIISNSIMDGEAIAVYDFRNDAREENRKLKELVDKK